MHLGKSLALALACAIAAAPAAAASLATGFGFASLYLTDWEGDFDALLIDALDPIEDQDTNAFGGATADADTSSDVTPNDNGGFAPEIYGSVDAYARADAVADGFATADAFSSLEWYLDNTSDDPMTLYLDFEWEVDSETGVMAPGDFAESLTEVALSAASYGDLFYQRSLLRNGDSFAEGDGFEIAFTVAGGGNALLSLEVLTETYADTVAPVPVPFAAPLLASGLVALFAVARRRTA